MLYDDQVPSARRKLVKIQILFLFIDSHASDDHSSRGKETKYEKHQLRCKQKKLLKDRSGRESQISG